MRSRRVSRRVVVAALLAGCSPGVALAAEQLVEESTGIAFRRIQRVAGVDYECVGTGLRKLFFFDVYAIAFCLESARVESALDQARAVGAGQEFFDELSRSGADKLVVLRMVRDVSAESMASAFRDSLEPILSLEKIDKLIETIPGDAEEDQSVLLYSRGSELVIELAGRKKELDDAEISSRLWQVWLGPRSITPGLKDSIAVRARAGVR